VTLRRARRALRKPPHVIVRRLLHEASVESERLRTPLRARAFDERALLRATRAATLDELWSRVVARAPRFDIAPPDDVTARAEDAIARRVDLLGSGPVDLGRPVDWSRDPKTGERWGRGYAPRLPYVRPPADVKLPWEISRLQWLLPAAQEHAARGDERYAAGARDVLDDWIDGNPYPLGVNWAIAMEPALRILSWTFLFHACSGSRAFADGAFRGSFLRALYLHGRFVSRNIERSDVNGNHYTADATGLVFAGLFLGEHRWAEEGWRILLEELPRQVHTDGVDFEAAFSYHRLVAELFELPAVYRRSLGLDVPGWYDERLAAMARFTAAITRPDGTMPVG